MHTPVRSRERTVFRLGLVYDERLVFEQVFEGPQPVRVGPGRRDTLVLPAEEYAGQPLRFDVRRDGAVELLVPAGVDTVLAPGGSARPMPPVSLADLVRAGGARPDGDGARCTVGLGGRGRARLGPYTVLFQVVRQVQTVAVTPERPWPRRLAQAAAHDPVWSASLLAASLLVSAIVGQAILYQRTTGTYLDNLQPPEDVAREWIQPDIVELEPPKPTPELRETPVQPVVSEAPPPKPTARPRHPARPAKPVTARAGDPERPTRTARATVLERTIAGALANSKLAIATDEPDADLAFRGGPALPGTGPGEAALVLAGANAAATTLERVPVARPVLERDAEATRDRGPGKAPEKPVQIVLDPLQPDGPQEHGDTVGKVLARKAGAVKRCYETALRTQPDLDGKVAIRFIVGVAGTITEAHVRGASGEFATCIRNVLLNVRGLPVLAAPASFSQSYVFSRN